MDYVEVLAFSFTVGTTLFGAAVGFTLGAVLAALVTLFVTGAPDAGLILWSGGVCAGIGALPGLFITFLFVTSPNK